MRPSLSIVCVTSADPVVRPFLERFRAVADNLGAELILGTHGAPATLYAQGLGYDHIDVQGSYFEELVDPVIQACSGDYVLRVDDDESISSGMLEWLLEGEWFRRDSWFFSRRHLWPDALHCLAKQPYFPDFQARLSVKRQARRPVKIHAAHAYPAYRAPAGVYLDHWVFLLRSREERRAMTAKYETIRTGEKIEASAINTVMPYDDPNPVTLPIDSFDLLRIVEETSWWREVGQRLPANLEQELQEFRESICR